MHGICGPMNFTVLILLGLLLAAFVLIGREFEERYPGYVDYKTNDKSTIAQQMRTGAFITIDYVSDLIWPGSRDHAIRYKQTRQTPEQARRSGGK